MTPAKSRDGEREALFVRIPTAEAQRLDRAAFELKLSKQDIVGGLVAAYVDPGSQESLASLRSLSAGGPPLQADGRRVVIETGEPALTVGRHDFRPAPEPAGEVLTLEEAAALLQVEAEEVERLARDGQLPGRRIGGAWRFARRAILDWLAAAPAQ